MRDPAVRGGAPNLVPGSNSLEILENEGQPSENKAEVEAQVEAEAEAGEGVEAEAAVAVAAAATEGLTLVRANDLSGFRSVCPSSVAGPSAEVPEGALEVRLRKINALFADGLIDAREASALRLEPDRLSWVELELLLAVAGASCMHPIS